MDGYTGIFLTDLQIKFLASWINTAPVMPSERLSWFSFDISVQGIGCSEK